MALFEGSSLKVCVCLGGGGVYVGVYVSMCDSVCGSRFVCVIVVVTRPDLFPTCL